MQDEEYWQSTMAPHAPAWQCTAVPVDSAFVVYTSSLHNMGWLPDNTTAKASAVAESLARQHRLAVPHPTPLVQGECSLPHRDLARVHDKQFVSLSCL